jgi:hypothetical protein
MLIYVILSVKFTLSSQKNEPELDAAIMGTDGLHVTHVDPHTPQTSPLIAHVNEAAVVARGLNQWIGGQRRGAGKHQPGYAGLALKSYSAAYSILPMLVTMASNGLS